MIADDDHYFDGISPELQCELDKMTPEEREASLKAEKKKSDEMKGWTPFYDTKANEDYAKESEAEYGVLTDEELDEFDNSTENKKR